MAERKGTQPKVDAPDAEAPIGTAQDGISRQSQFSEVKENGEIEESNPPAGKQSVEVLGKPKKGVFPAVGS